MSEPRFVQHVSGQGEKWEQDQIQSRYPSSPYWFVKHGMWGVTPLPKSEYRLCNPPEKWTDVTEKCRINEQGTILHEDGISGNSIVVCRAEGYRLIKSQLCRSYDISHYIDAEKRKPIIQAQSQWAFLVEKRQP